LARAVELNAAFWAEQATLVTGSNDVSADGAQVTPTSAPSRSSPPPRFALDVAAIGGMYVGKIHLIGTEAGLGVNMAGLIQAGELTLDPNGWLSHQSGARTFADRIDIRAEGVRNEPGAVIAARERLAIDAGRSIV